MFYACSKKTDSDHQVVAKIGSRVITKDEFKYRAELTIRPTRVQTARAVMNNLIAEKLFALEAGDTSILSKSEVFQAYIQGIREQSMREMLYNETAYNKVRLNQTEIDQTYQLSQMVYDVEFFTINNPKIAEVIESRLTSGEGTKSTIFEQLKSSGESGIQTVKWRDPEHDNIHQALFNRPVDPGEVLGPVRIGQDQWIMMRVQNRTTQPVIGPEDNQIRMDEVKAKLTDLKARTIWQNYKNNMMRGKQMRFNPEVLNQMVQWYQNQEKDQNNPEIPQPDDLEDAQNKANQTLDLDALLDQLFLTIDGETWTVGDFKREIMSHPLVYRQDIVRPHEFKERFKQAVADLVVDHYLNQEAYHRGLDRHKEVQHQGELWEDAFLAKYHLTQYLKKIKVGELQKKDPSYLGTRAVDEYLAELKKKYGKKIEVDSKGLSEIELIQIPLFVLRPGMPYPVAVPEFPYYTMTDTLMFEN